MSDKDLKLQIEELKEINKGLEKQLYQLYKEKDTASNDDLITDYQKNFDNE
jgi:hypothetical protein